MDIRLRGVEPADAELLYAMEGEGFNEEYGDLLAPLSLEMLRTYALTYEADPFAAGSLRLIAEVDGEHFPAIFCQSLRHPTGV